MDKKKIGIFICKLRNERKWTQEDLANKLYVDRTVVSKWERGLYIPGAEELLKMQELFEVSINEILYGEGKDINNDKNVDSVPLKIMEDEKIKRMKIYIISTILFFILIVLFLSYYLITNYNSVKVYKIYSEKEDYTLNNGFLFFSNTKSYIRIGDINNDDDIKSVKFYYQMNGKDKIIMDGDIEILDKIYTNDFNYNELYSYNELNYIIANSKIELIKNDGKKVILDLLIREDYSNDKLINNYKKHISDGDIINIKNDIPQNIKKYFRYDKKDKVYIRNNEFINEYYYPDTKIYVLTFNESGNEEKYSFHLKSNVIEHQLFFNTTIEDNYSFDINNNTCLYGSCNVEKIKNIKSEYLDKIFF